MKVIESDLEENTKDLILMAVYNYIITLSKVEASEIAIKYLTAISKTNWSPN
jgi:hypothetical protein